MHPSLLNGQNLMIVGLLLDILGFILLIFATRKDSIKIKISNPEWLPVDVETSYTKDRIVLTLISIVLVLIGCGIQIWGMFIFK